VGVRAVAPGVELGGLQAVECLILRVLAVEGRDGSGIVAEVAAISGGRVRLRAGRLFRALSRLQAERLVSAERIEGGTRGLQRRYRITLAGQQRLAAAGAADGCGSGGGERC
jgi:DNA-binding PadR family transcriptional regulator